MAGILIPNRTPGPSDSRGLQRRFAPDRLTLGVFFPIKAFSGDQPTMLGQELDEGDPSVHIFRDPFHRLPRGLPRNAGDVLEEISKEILPQLAAPQP